MTKNPDALRTISEVADDLDLPQHVLRFWETRFNQIKPMKRGGGRRYYRPDDIDLLRGIKALLYDEGYTIRGVQRLLKEQGVRVAVDFGNGVPLSSGPVDPSFDMPPQDSAPAVSVSDISAMEPKKSKGILGRFSSRRDTTDGPGFEISSHDDIKTLRATLEELLECKRLLDQTRQH
ncbi:MAG: MerR family transcriptional regulator [Pseudomonadota bacterium]